MASRYPPSPLQPIIKKPPGVDSASDFGIDQIDEGCCAMLGLDAGGTAAGVARGVLYGMVNAVLNIPALIGYASIIFAHPFFQPHLPQLVKLVLWSSFVHQCVFTLRSKMPFAIGQVQDAGLIFLSAMTTSVVQIVDADAATFPPGTDISQIKTTTACYTLAIATTLLGLALMATGALRGAAFVQYLPMPVVSGYLAYIGLFCVEAGLALTTGKDINPDPHSWARLLSWEAAAYAFPAMLAGIILLHVNETFSPKDNPAALPLAFLAIPALFYVILVMVVGLEKGEWGMGEATTSGQANGWLTQPSNSSDAGFVAAFDVFMSPGIIYWRAVVRQIPTWLGMYFVVAFSSCLDVAAIEMDLQGGDQELGELDVNHELGNVVGFSNLCSGITGGFTGSYIISLTVFTLRLAPDSRAVGWTCAMASLIMCFLPFAATDYIPIFVFAGALIFIGLDLMLVFLVKELQRLSWIESSLVVGSFVCINAAGLESGLVLGIALTAVAFIFEFATGSAVTRVRMASCAHRRPEQRDYLRAHHAQIVQLRLQGHLFFGSALTVLQHVKQNIHVPADLSLNPAQIASEAQADEQSRLLQYTTQAGIPLARLTSLQKVVSYEKFDELAVSGGPGLTGLSSPELQNAKLYPRKTRFLILDFSAVSAVDTTAVRTCFLTLRQQLQAHDITTVFTGMLPEVEAQFRRCDLLDQIGQNTSEQDDELLNPGKERKKKDKIFEVVDEALEWCEDEMLNDADLPSSSLESDDRQGYIACVLAELHPETLEASAFRGIADQFEFVEYKRKEDTKDPEDSIIYTVGAESTCLYIVLSGIVLLQQQVLVVGAGADDTHHCAMKTVSGGRLRPGNLFGETDWHVGTPRTYQARVGSEGALVAKLSKEVKLTDRDRVLLLEVLLSHMSVQLLSADGEL